MPTTDPRSEASARLQERYGVRVLEPSPPAVTEGPFLADDPVNAPGPPGLAMVSPVPNAELTWHALAAADPDADLAEFCADRWLGAWRRLPDAPPAALAETRVALHAVAQHLLSAARFQANGKVGLRYTRGGFGTPFFGHDRQLRVEGEELVVAASGSARRLALTTIGRLAEEAGVQPGAPTEIYQPSAPLRPDDPIVVDLASSDFLGEWYGFCASVLEEQRWTWEASDVRVQLWPEHFDLAFEAGDAGAGGRASYGGSPGDEAHDEPYLYVSPWSEVDDDPFWNDTAFRGASFSFAALAAAEDQRSAGLAFYAAGRARLEGQAPAGGGKA